MFFIIYYLMGICGIVRMLWETFFPEAEFAVLLTAALGIGAGLAALHLLWRLWLRKWKKEHWVMLGLALAALLLIRAAFSFVWPLDDLFSWTEGFDGLYQSVLITARNHFYPADPVSRVRLVWREQTYQAFCMVLAVFSFFLYYAVVVRLGRAGVLTALLLPLAAVLTVGVTPSLEALCLILLCCVGVFAGRRTLARRAPARALAATALSLVLLAVSSAAAAWWDGHVEERKLETRQWVRNTFTFTDFPVDMGFSLPGFPGLGRDPGELSNEEEIQYTGEVAAVLTTTRQPDGTLYLKNYHGSVYTGHGWDRQWEDRTEPDSYEMAGRLETSLGRTGQQELTVEAAAWLSGTYVPYFSQQVDRQGAGRVYQCFWPQRYLELAGQAQAGELEDAWDGKRRTVRTGSYLDWPGELEELNRICQENPCDGLEETRQFIVSWLSRTCSYNLQVGKYPEDRDPVEYFLFEKREGYCQHFASAAVMMFRMYGIPARYATGLAVPAHLFSETSNPGVFEARPTDRCAHAWVEIYQESLGWIPVEVTPGNAVDGVSPWEQEIVLADAEEPVPDRETPAPEPEDDSRISQQQEDLSESEAQTDDLPGPEEQTDRLTEPEEQDGIGGDPAADPAAPDAETETGEGIFGIWGRGEDAAGPPFWESEGFQAFLAAARKAAEAAAAVLLVVLLLWLRRRLLLAGRKRKSAAGIFDDLMEVLEKGGLPAGGDWLEDDFAETVCERFPWLERKDFQAALDAAAEELYGEPGKIEGEKAAVWNLYLQCCREVRRKLNRRERLWFRVWKAYD